MLAAPVLGAQLAVAGNVANPAAAVLTAPTWLGIATAIVAHLQTAATVLPGSLTAPPAGGPLTGAGAIGGMSASTLGDALNTAAGTGAAQLQARYGFTKVQSAIDAAPALAVWTGIAAAMISQLTSVAVVTPASMVAPPAVPPAPATTGGPVTGTGTISGLDASALGEAFNKAAGTSAAQLQASIGLTMAASVVAAAPALQSWTAVATAIVSHVETAGVANAAGLMCPPGGGPITGAGVLS
jgi:hypothetical protein